MPGSIFQENKAELEDQFLKGFLDDKIDECVDLGQEPFDFELVPSIQTILRKSRADQQEEVLRKERELRARVHSATYDQLCFRLEDDVKLLREHYKALADNTVNNGQLVKRHKDRRYARGLKEIEKRMETQLRVPQYMDVSALTSAIADFKKNMAEVVKTGDPSCSYTLVVLDFTHAPSFKILEGLLTRASEILQQSQNHALLLP